MLRIRQWWAAALIALTLALPTTAALAADQAPASPQYPHYFPCQYTREIDNNQVNSGSNPFWDDLGNQWIVYYDYTQDVHNSQICNMRVTMRIFNPPPDGSWNGTASVYAYIQGTYDSNSYGQVSGSGTYQYHFLWHGPWFAAGDNGSSYLIIIYEFNGSNTYARAYATFSL